MKVVGFRPVYEDSNFKRNPFTSTCGIHVYFLDVRISSFIHYYSASCVSVRDVIHYSSFFLPRVPLSSWSFSSTAISVN